MGASKLVKTSTDYQESYLEALSEFHEEGRYTFLSVEELRDEEKFASFVGLINEGKKHLHKPLADWVEPVPETVLWFVKDGEFLGTFNIRHRLNWHLEKWGGHVNFVIRPSMRAKGFGKKILLKGMPYVMYMGIERALLTVSPANEAAIKIVEHCGAVLEDETQETDKFPARLRYWLDCK